MISRKVSGFTRFLAGPLATIVGRASRASGRGSGEAVAGLILNRLDPGGIERISRDKSIVLVSATNGKTTTTAMCVSVLSKVAPVFTNASGNNMTPGVALALENSNKSKIGVLEVDEAHLGEVARRTGAQWLVLMNLSRDQLDRISEVKSLALRWKKLIDQNPEISVIANVSDPHIHFATMNCNKVVRVALGNQWKLDSTVCPVCDSALEFGKNEFYRCIDCDFRMPTAKYSFESEVLYRDKSAIGTVHVGLPGHFNACNGALAAILGIEWGLSPEDALLSVSKVRTVAGRYDTIEHKGLSLTTLMAKNPAGWQALIDMLASDERDIVIGINARVADGRDTSWLYDVDFGRFSTRRVICFGDRRWDIGLRLSYANVDHEVVESFERALSHVVGSEAVVVGNYTAFQDARSTLRVSSRPNINGGV
ncbi:MurT ligase domain-containing protein [Acidithrix ferrooxidans]|uniref:Lipid II isoglutaminyl synthase (glutamine-hydrolyzing) subunit MurT n=1 Tax=Acidithrix ferrooxidans TaxID=1280514 RepID=A0A0D8HMH4_9ACTN|nr:MurT ligase domain-containing protein [Acidithrix ferrooxidans]KJF18942.1 UDP-N-acetylmuramoyl-L-alanyl-D-glutamate--2,6-diaminopimelate ligase [Acidithrix ferrooxidans]